MNLLLNKNIQKYFLTKNTKITCDEKVDIILSPQFYWIRIFNIPVSNCTQALKVMNNLFENILPENEDFLYHIVKLEDKKFLCFAFNNDTILEYIKLSTLNLAQINTVYFAQTQMKHYKSFTIDNSTFIYEKDILIKINSSLCKNTKVLSNNLNQLTIPNKLDENKVNIKFYSNTINTKYIYILSIILFAIIFINISKYISYSNNINDLNQINVKLIKKHNIPKTNLQMNSILNSMQKKVNKNTNFREVLSYILKFNKINNTKIEKIVFKNDKLILAFSNAKWSILKTYIEKKYTIINKKLNDNLLEIEIKI